LTNKQKEVQLR
jgi:hypothetical protein